MKKRKPKETLRSGPIDDAANVEMLYAAAEAHPSWEVLPDDEEIPTRRERVAEYATRAA